MVRKPAPTPLSVNDAAIMHECSRQLLCDVSMHVYGCVYGFLCALPNELCITRRQKLEFVENSSRSSTARFHKFLIMLKDERPLSYLGGERWLQHFCTKIIICSHIRVALKHEYVRGFSPGYVSRYFALDFLMVVVQCTRNSKQ